MDIIKNSKVNFIGSSYYDVAADKNDNSIYFTKDEIGSILVNGKIYGQGNYVEITYDDLVKLTTSNSLHTGVLYKIIDYTTTTKQTSTNSAGHVFDIIVEAISSNELSENAKVSLHKGDTYFANCNLGAWEIKYSLYNDTNRFAWADEVNGKGVIYYMKDDCNNEAWYDFKNIRFLRTRSWFSSDNPYFWCSGNFATSSKTEFYFYTFSGVNGTTITDDSLFTSTNYHATDNHLGRSTAKITKLNNTIFIDKLNNGAFNNIIADGHNDNTFGHSIWNNMISHNFKNNKIYHSFQYNDIREKFELNNVLNSFSYNTVEAGCYNNNFNGSVNRCLFRQAYTLNNFIGESLSHCTFGCSIKYVSDIPKMRNVIFTNECIVGDSSVYLNNLTTSGGNTLLNEINSFDETCEYTIVKRSDGLYEITSYKNIQKIDNIYDLGSFNSSDEGENAATNANVAINKRYTFLKYYVSSKNCVGFIEQSVSPEQSSNGTTIINTTQYLNFEGTRYVRTLTFTNVVGNWSLTNKGSWQKLFLVTESEWNNRLSGAVLTSSDQNIGGVKKFTNNVSLTGKTTISTTIDPGELKVLHNNSSKGFILRTKNT